MKSYHQDTKTQGQKRGTSLGVFLGALVPWWFFFVSCETRLAPEVRRAIELGEELHDKREYNSAAVALGEARALPMPERWRVDVTFLYAHALAKSGRIADAREEFARIAREHPRHFKASRALEALAELAPTTEAARRRYLKVIRRYPSTQSARNAVKWLVDHLANAKRDVRGAVELLKRLYLRDPVGPLADLILYNIATLLEDRLGNVAAAEHLYVKIADEFGEGGLCDDARWRRAQILRRQQRLDELVQHLRGMSEERRASWNMGTYNSRFVEPAQLLLARVFLEDLKLYPEAREELDIFEDAFPRSIQIRDVAWLRVQSFVAEGRGADARRVLEALVRDYGETRVGRRAKRVLAGDEPLPRPAAPFSAAATGSK